jgi:hypothetical protein
MDTSTSPRELEAVRQRRAELRESMAAFEASLEAPDEALLAAVRRISGDFALHVEVTEGPDGLHQAILAGDLRLANQVNALAMEHGEITAQLDDPAKLREQGGELIAKLRRHQQRGADLIHEAFQADIGGCG